jgi:phosphoglycerate dehydrogenase-like enzyme
VSWNVLLTARTLDVVGHSAIALLNQAKANLVQPSAPSPFSAVALLEALPNIDAVLASMDRFTGAVMASPAAARLKIISRWGVGYDAVDVPTATQQGIVVAYTPGLLNETVADYAFALLLSVARRVHQGHLALHEGVWQSAWGHDIHGKTLGLLGCGRIGQAVARRAKAFELRVIAHDPTPSLAAQSIDVEYVSLDELLSLSDFLSLHAALTPENRGMLGRAQLQRMKPTAYLINTARGALIDEAALVQALQEGRIAGAALDAFTTEPLPADHALRSAPNLLITPHQASFARETGERVSLTAAQAIVDLMQGRRPQFTVNPEVYDSPVLRAQTTPPHS